MSDKNMERKKTPEELEKDVMVLREWIHTQSQLPEDIEPVLLRRFIHSCYFDLERAKLALEKFFSIRRTSPELFSDRDPHSKEMQKNFSLVKMAYYRISGGRHIRIFLLNDPGMANFDYLQFNRMSILVADLWLLDEQPLAEADVLIVDAKHINYRFLTKFKISVARKVSKYQQEAIPIRLKQMHMVNAPSIIHTVMGLMKPVMGQEYVDMLHIHTPGSSTLFDHLDKSELPADYGGTLPTMDELNTQVLAAIENKREFFLNEDLWKAIEIRSAATGSRWWSMW